MKMKHFFANFIAMFFISKKLRRRIRTKIMGENNQKIHEEFLLNTLNLINEKQKRLNDLEQKYKYLQLKAEWLTHNDGKLLLPGSVNEYDLIFAIGATCHVTTLLDKFHFRRFSSPFDWTTGVHPKTWVVAPDVYRDSRFHEKIQALCDNFKDWLNPKNFKYVSQYINQNTKHHVVVNVKNKTQFIHEFPVEQDIMQHMPEFINKMNRRITHLYDAIDKSQHILVLWVSSIWDQRTYLEKNVSDKDIKWAIKKLQKKYPNKYFDLVFFEPDGTKDRFEYEKIEVAPGAFIIKSNHFLTDAEYGFKHPTDNLTPHIHVISEMLDNIHLSKDAFQLPDKTS